MLTVSGLRKYVLKVNLVILYKLMYWHKFIELEEFRYHLDLARILRDEET